MPVDIHMQILNLSAEPTGRLRSWLPHDLSADKVVFLPDTCPDRSSPLPTGPAVLLRGGPQELDNVPSSDSQHERSFTWSRNGNSTGIGWKKGNCWDNAPTERFFRSLKSERLTAYSFATRKQAEMEILDYITFYDSIRLHSTLGYLSPMAYEKEQYLKVA